MSASRLDGRRQFHTLDGLRGVAALSIVFFHCGTIVAPIVFPSAYLAVDLFFALSGFVLAHAYEERFAAGMTTGAFMRARVIRLYPLYALGTLLGLTLAVITIAMVGSASSMGWSPRNLATVCATAIFMLPSVSRHFANLYPLDSPAWSLLAELAVNFVYVAIWRWLHVRLLAGIILISLVLLAFYALSGAHALNAGWNWATVDSSFVRAGYSFFMGVLLLRLFRAGRLPRVRVPAWVVPLGIMLLFVAWPTGGHRALFDLLCAALVFPIAIAAGATNEPSGPALRRAFTIMGTMSYAIYILHYPIVDFFRAIAYRGLHRDPAFFAPMGGLAVIGFVAIGAYVVDGVYDQPVRRWLTRTFIARSVRIAAES